MSNSAQGNTNEIETQLLHLVSSMMIAAGILIRSAASNNNDHRPDDSSFVNDNNNNSDSSSMDSTSSSTTTITVPTYATTPGTTKNNNQKMTVRLVEEYQSSMENSADSINNHPWHLNNSSNVSFLSDTPAISSSNNCYYAEMQQQQQQYTDSSSGTSNHSMSYGQDHIIEDEQTIDNNNLSTNFMRTDHTADFNSNDFFQPIVPATVELNQHDINNSNLKNNNNSSSSSSSSSCSSRRRGRRRRRQGQQQQRQGFVFPFTKTPTLCYHDPTSKEYQLFALLFETFGRGRKNPTKQERRYMKEQWGMRLTQFNGWYKFHRFRHNAQLYVYQHMVQEGIIPNSYNALIHYCKCNNMTPEELLMAEKREPNNNNNNNNNNNSGPSSANSNACRFYTPVTNMDICQHHDHPQRQEEGPVAQDNSFQINDTTTTTIKTEEDKKVVLVGENNKIMNSNTTSDGDTSYYTVSMY